MLLLMNNNLYLGKLAENLVVSKLMAGLRETYLPVVDDHGVDLIVRTRRGDSLPAEGLYCFDEADAEMKRRCLEEDFQEVQVKSGKSSGPFAAFTCEPRANYWFVFYVEDIGVMWLMHSADVARYGSFNRPGTKNACKCSITLAGRGKVRPALARYVVTDLSKLP